VLPEGVKRDLFIVNGRITFTEQEDATTILDGGYLIPGLVDAHAHLSLASPAPRHAPPDVRVRASAKVQLDAGVLALREPGSPDHASLSLGPHEGLPRTFTGGRFLAPPGGYFPGLSREATDEELPGAAEEEARASGARAKIIGEWPTEDGRMQANYRPETLAEAARMVHSVGARIAIHANIPDSIEAAIEAGFDSIEHGWGLQDNHIQAMRAREITFVPTIIITTSAPYWIPGLGVTPSWQRTLLEAARRHPEVVLRAVEAGVQVLAGTDAGMGPHGRVAEEIELMLNAGMPPDLALGAASWLARRFLGLPGIEEGGAADIVAYPDDPRGDTSVLARPSLVILDGRVILSPGMGHAHGHKH
jgi:imidazolonepropionase-like amidohydrolase